MTIVDSRDTLTNQGGGASGATATVHDDGTFTFDATIERILFQSNNSSWGIALVRPERSVIQTLNQARPPTKPSRFREDPTVVKCVGVLASTSIGIKLTITGAWEVGKYGLQFSVRSTKLLEGIIGDDATTTSVVKLLTSFRGVGPVIAGEIVAKFAGDGLVSTDGWQRALVNDLNGEGKVVAQVCEQHSAPQALYESIMAGWRDLAGKANVLSFLYDCGFGSAIAQRIFDWYCEKRQLAGDRVIEMIRENPYRLIDDISGVGFKMADEAALKLGVPPDSLFRKVACLAFCLQEAAQDGHTILLRSEAHERCMQAIGQPMVQLLPGDVEASLCAEQRGNGVDNQVVLVLVPSDEALAKKFRLVFAKGVRQFYVGSRHLVESEVLVSGRVKEMLR